MRQPTLSEDIVYPYAHQLELLAYLFPRRPIRVLIGDEIGLGKTIEAIMLIKYLQEVNLAKRVLILVPRILIDQWKGELKKLGFENIFQIEKNNLNTISKVDSDKGIYIISVDLAKREQYKNRLKELKWDVIVVDEAHRIGKVNNKETQRFELVLELTKNAENNVIFLSATPHRGKPDDYVNRLRLIDPYLDPDINPDNDEFYKTINRRLIYRRTKSDINEIYEKRQIFTRCTFKAKVIEATKDEVEFHQKLVQFLGNVLKKYHKKSGNYRSAIGLLLVLIAKRASSSPLSALRTLERILNRRANQLKSQRRPVSYKNNEEIVAILSSGDMAEYDDILNYKKGEISDIIDEKVEEYSEMLDQDDVNALKELYELACSINKRTDSRLQNVMNVIKSHLDNDDKVVLFTEFKDTAEYIFRKLKENLHGSLRDKMTLITSDGIETSWPHVKKATIEDVKRWLAEDKIKIIVSTDVASEGLNLQHANVIIHYEPPWSPIKIVQRIGRVWRLGQKKDVISYTVLLGVESDSRVLEILYGKLLSWYLSGVENRVVVGEKIETNKELDIDLSRNESDGNQDLLVLGPGKGTQFNEYEAWLSFIEKGGKGLENYVSDILNKLKSLKAEAERFKNEEGDKKVKIHKFLSEILKGLYGMEADETLRKTLRLVAKLKGVKVEENDLNFFNRECGNINKDNISSLYKCICTILECNKINEKAPLTPIALRVASGNEDVDELAIYKVKLNINGTPYYSEVVGVKYKGNEYEVTRGIEFLKTLINALDNVLDVENNIQNDKEDKEVMKISNEFKDKVIRELLDPFIKYLQKTEKELLSKIH
ncbi:DEAD/DEAH box helicase, partial [Metallosphaera sp.]|uniref:DEAD/DEAH box helicase n=1 Tax=Metallosphaera sp. TaxID=2020860 RepID=UPI00319DB089